MKNFKKVLALTLALAVIMSSMTVAFAASANDAKAKVLYDLGLFKGTSATEYVPALEDESNAQQALVLIGRALKWPVDMAATTEFTDVADWAAPYVAYAVEKGITNGVSATEFGASFDGKRMVTWFLRALGYDMTESWTKTTELAATAKITVPTATTRDAVVGVIYEGLSSTPVGGTKTLVETVVGSDAALLKIAQDAGLIAKELAVVSVTATNLRVVEVKFNTAVIEAEAKKVANYTIGSDNPAAAVVSADMKMVTLTLGNANAKANYSKADLKIKKAVGLAADVTVKDVSFTDTVVPTILSVEATGPRTLKVTFSEVMDEDAVDTAITGITLDAGTVALDAANGVAVAANKTTATIKTLSNLTEGTHSLEVKNTTVLKDNAGYKVVPSTVAFAYVKDTSALTFTVEETKENSVKIKFNKALTTGSFKTNNLVYITHTYDTDTNKVWANNVGVVATDDEQTFTITFANPLVPGTSTVFIGYAADTADSAKIRDDFGNVLAATSFSVNVVADVAVPVAQSVEFKSATSLEVTYSEVVGSIAIDKTKYTLKDSTAAVVKVTAANWKDSDHKVVVLTTETINGGVYTLAIKDVKDVSVAQNKMADTTLTFTATDKVAPTVTDKDSNTAGIQVKEVGTNKVRVEFSEAMNADDITNKANWKLDGSDLLADDTIVAVNSNKAVEITFDATVIDGTKDLTLIRVKDAAGNYMDAWTTTLDVTNLANVGVKETQVTGKNEVKIVIEDTITGFTVDDFAVSVAGAANEKATGISGTVVDGKTTLTLTIATNILETDVAAGNIVTVTSGNWNGAVFTGGATQGAKNQYSTAVQFGANTALDKIGVNAFTAVTKDTGSNGKIDAVVLTFKEALYVASVSDADFTVAGYEVKGVALSGADKVVTLTLKELDDADTNATPKVTLVGSIEDVARNVNATISAVTSTDGAGAAIVGLAYNGTTSLTVTFSEAIADASLADADFTIGGTGWTAETVTVATGATANDNTVVLTISADPTLTVGQTLTIALSGAGVITDAAAVVSTQTAAVTYTK